MGNIFSPTHLIVILLIILVLFGRGKVSELMGDVAKGIKAFKKNMKEEEESVEDKLKTTDYSKTIDIEPQQSQPLSVKRIAARRKSSSSSQAGKTSVTKNKRVKE
ncbi:twin arginine translocase protein A [Candidatus Bartonella washoeensis]|uniref:Sec-independent protein translocase protein TatA n=1 Tax=Candidatus Bartonella washoeensis Sb944nv TaxID=1094563 RepID=J1JC92_9HYPH|nr:twin-arginine translocase TatA/TatE family subunit [Bartonella washoeensis]EJF81645.1 TatA/E family twin arginine-targeting protein translocase [Bartonella washoeensis Sb944nv]SPU26943.1 twin arginine translocase protein A [Bartonella washoeensis]